MLDNATSIVARSDTQEDNSQLPEETEDTENAKSNTALAETAGLESRNRCKCRSVVNLISI